jgi:hypothetical protein
MDEPLKLGQFITNGDRRRDATHIALAPVTASCELRPGQRVGLVQRGNLELVGPCEKNIGVVDPWLILVTDTIQKGQRFLLLLDPNTITGLRHVWRHSSFTEAVQIKLRENLDARPLST